MDENAIKTNISRNIAQFRRRAGLTQLELGAKLNYTDKAVSKWERGESLPDVVVLKRIANLLNITVDDLLSERREHKIYIGISIEKRVLIPLISILFIFLVATFAFGVLLMSQTVVESAWLVYIIAIPISAICALVFSAIWGKQLLTGIFTSLLVWSAALLLYLTVDLGHNYIYFIAAGIGQVIIVLWSLLLTLSRRNKLRREVPMQNF